MNQVEFIKRPKQMYMKNYIDMSKTEHILLNKEIYRGYIITPNTSVECLLNHIPIDFMQYNIMLIARGTV